MPLRYVPAASGEVPIELVFTSPAGRRIKNPHNFQEKINLLANYRQIF